MAEWDVFWSFAAGLLVAEHCARRDRLERERRAPLALAAAPFVPFPQIRSHRAGSPYLSEPPSLVPASVARLADAVRRSLPLRGGA